MQGNEIKKEINFMKKIIYILSCLRYSLKITFKFLTNFKAERIIIMATPTHGNLGDQAIVFAEKKAIKMFCPSYSVIEIENGAYLKCKRLIKNFVRETDTIIIDGGGNLGTLWPWEDDKITDIISTFSQNKIVIFPQTVFYEASDASSKRIEKNNNVYVKAKDLTVLLRDEASFEFFVRTFPEIKAKLCPDIVLSLNQRQNLNRNGVLLCLRADREKIIGENEVVAFKEYLKAQGIEATDTDTVIKKNVRPYNRKRELQKKWKEFSASALVVTDRLHAMIFSYITGTPCIAINNKSKKVEGAFRFINKCNFIKMATDLTDVIKIIPTLPEAENCNSNEFVYPLNILEEVLKDGASKQ